MVPSFARKPANQSRPKTLEVLNAQLAIGANHRVYAGYMDGNSQYTLIVVTYSDDHGTKLLGRLGADRHSAKTAPANDRLIAIYNAGAGSNGAPERIYTK